MKSEVVGDMVLGELEEELINEVLGDIDLEVIGDVEHDLVEKMEVAVVTSDEMDDEEALGDPIRDPS